MNRTAEEIKNAIERAKEYKGYTEVIFSHCDETDSNETKENLNQSLVLDMIVLEALQQALEIAEGKKQVVEWQPIETAPKDGKPFMAGWFGYVPEQAHYDLGSECFVKWTWQKGLKIEDGDTPNYFEVQPTHWAPLPNPPKSNTTKPKETESD